MHVNAVTCIFVLLAYNYNEVYSTWYNWYSWSSCSVTCGIGGRYRIRYCDTDCYGASGYTTEACNPGPCPVDGLWTCWATWGSCSLTCGIGIYRRYRTCDNPAPAFGGNDCIGSSTDTGYCNTHSCPVNGQWSSWSNWTICASCKAGYQNRTRECNVPAPAYGGKYCDGISMEILHCSDSCQELDEITCCSPGIVAGVAIACIIMTLICVVVVSIARKYQFPLGLNNQTLEFDHNQQHQSPSVNNPQYAGQDNAVCLMDDAGLTDYNRIANQVQSTEDSEIYENMKI